MTMPRTSANIEISDASSPRLSSPDSSCPPSTPAKTKVAADPDNARIKSATGYDDAERSEPTRVNIRPARRLPVEKDWPTSAIVAVQAGILIAIIAGWEIGAATGFIDKFFWSNPTAIYHTLIVFFTTGDAFTDIAFTFRSTILGFLIGTFAGSALGLSFWWSRNYAAIMQPYIICFESLPKLALAPLIVLVFGIGIASKIAIATALTLIVSTLTTFAGVKAVDPDGEKLFYSLGATRLQVFRKFVIPSCLPWIISVLRVNIGLALTGAIVGEFIASQHGLGRAIIYAGQTYDIALVWVAVSVLSTLAVVMYIAVSWIERLLQKGIRG
jgi:NitT/TauT family transport system permease protein